MFLNSLLICIYSAVFFLPIAYPAFIFTNNSYLHEKRNVLRGSSAFINCSIDYGTVYNRSLWQFENDPVLVNMTSKYALNESGLLINNVTVEDQGNYTCSVGSLKADILVVVICECHKMYAYILNFYLQGLQNYCLNKTRQCW